MNKKLVHCFSGSRFSRWPLWKVVFALTLAAALAGGVLAMGAPAAVQAIAPRPTPTATPVPTPEPVVMQKHLDTGWLNINWTDSGLKPAVKKPAYKAAIDLRTRQQDLYVEVYATDRITKKTSFLKHVPVTVTVSCAELFKVEHKEHQYDNPVSKVNATVQYQLDTKTGKLKIPKLAPGKYAVSLSTSDRQYAMPKIQYVKVKERVDYKKDDTTAKKETAEDAKEDKKPAQSGSGETVVVTPVKAGLAYAAADTRFWQMPGSDKQYLYAADGVTRTPYRMVVKSATGAEGARNGKKVQILHKAVFDKAADAWLLEQARPTPAPAAEEVSGISLRRAAHRQRPQVVFLSAENPLPLEEGTPATEVPPPAETPVPETPAPPVDTPAPTDTPAPELTPTPVPEATATPAPVPTDTPAPEATATPAPSESPAPTASPEVSATPSPTPTPAPTDTPQPTPVPVESYPLFDENGAKVENTVFALPAPIKIALNSVMDESGKVLGIDVSKYQPSINWNEVKASGVEFVIIRMGYRGYGSGKIVEDPYFRQHLKGAKAAGLKVGVYFFSQAIDEKEAVEEASACLNALGGQKLDYPIFFDTEFSNSSKNGRADGLSKGERTACAIAFSETVRSAGYRAGIYASTNWFRNHLILSDLSSYTIWNAHYGVSASPLSCHIWQYTGNGRVNGVYDSKGQLAPVDLNISYIG